MPLPLPASSYGEDAKRMRPYSPQLQKGAPDTAARGMVRGKQETPKFLAFLILREKQNSSRSWKWGTGVVLGIGEEALEVWPMGTTPLFSDLPHYRELSPPSPTTRGKM